MNRFVMLTYILVTVMGANEKQHVLFVLRAMSERFRGTRRRSIFRG
jgi:hypothetical protein